MKIITGVCMLPMLFAQLSDVTAQSQKPVYSHAPGKLVEINGKKLWVEEEGKGEPLILLPGGPANSHLTFHPYFTQLSDRFRVIYFDYYGRGQSDYPESYEKITFEGDVEDLEGLRKALGLEQFHLYGFSYGGMVAQAYALKYGAHVKKLILANTLHSAEMWQKNHENINRELSNQFPEEWDQIMEMRNKGIASSDSAMKPLFALHSKIIRFYNPDHAGRLLSEPKSRNDELYYTFAGRDIEFFIGNQVAALPDFRPHLKNLAMPVLIIAGRYDRALYPRYQMEFKKYCPQATFVMMERSGSFSHIEEPETLLNLVREFLNKYD